MTDSSGTDQLSAVEKALLLLTAFGEEAATGVGVTELARRTDLPKTTAYRVLADLEKHGAVERAGTAYRIGPLLQELGATKQTAMHARLRDALTPSLVKLYEETRQTVHLGVLHGTHVVYLNKLYGRQGVRSPSRIGGQAPAYCTAVGKALLAYSPAETEQVLAAPREQWTPHTITGREELLAELETVRAEQFSYDRQEILLGLTCVGAPVFNATGQAVASLSISGQTGIFHPQEHLTVLRRVIYEATRAATAATARDA